MNKRGVALIFGLLVVVVLSILSGYFYLKTINESNQAKKFINSLRAFWLAEAGIAEAINHLPNLATSGSIGDSRYIYVAETIPLTSGYHNIISTGSVTAASGEITSRRLSAILKTGTVDPTKFKYAIETTTDLYIKGSVDINPDDSKKENSALDFTDLFSYSKADIKAHATHLYTPSNFSGIVNGITWIDVPAGETFTAAGNWQGSGILIICGDTHISGTIVFDGIIYVIGKLTITGTVTTNGSVLAESSTTVDTVLKGNVTLNYNQNAISGALDPLRLLNVDIVAWREMQLN